MTNAVGRFLGGSPAMVAVRLIVVSFVVGIVLETFGFDPATSVCRSRAQPQDRSSNLDLATSTRSGGFC